MRYYPHSMRSWSVAALAVTCLAMLAPSPRAGNVSVVAWLDGYANGQHDAVVRELAALTDFEEVLKQLRRDGPQWIERAGPDQRTRRELAAATFSLEAARAGARHDWKRTQKQPPMCAGGSCYQPLNVLYWKAPPLLIEWGCALLRRNPEPRPAERWWQLAALAVAQYSEDTQFLVGDPAVGQGVTAGEIGNVADEIKHLDHVSERLPGERRFLLGQGIARDRAWPMDAAQAYRALENDPDVGGEATMRFGAMQMRLRRPGDALKSFERAQELTRDPYVIYLTHYFSGQLFERQPNLKLAEMSYRRAVAAVPHAQSATLALATLLARSERRAEAQELVSAMLAAPRAMDPWRRFVHADDRFWPQLITRLRLEINP